MSNPAEILLSLAFLGEKDFSTRLKALIKEKTEENNRLLKANRAGTARGEKVYVTIREKKLFGCQNLAVIELVSALLNEDLLKERNRIAPIPFSMIKLRNNPNSHSYPLHTPLIFIGPLGGHNMALGKGGSGGNNVPERAESYEEVGEEEVEDFFVDFSPEEFMKGVVK